MNQLKAGELLSRRKAQVRVLNANQDMEFVVAGTTHLIPGDGGTTNIMVSHYIADAFGCPHEALIWPTVPRPEAGRLSSLFGLAPSEANDQTALAEYLKDGEVETTQTAWGGVYVTPEEAFLDIEAAGELPEEYYLNGLVDVHTASPYVGNVDFLTAMEGDKMRVIGGKYRHASKVTPPLRLAPSFPHGSLTTKSSPNAQPLWPSTIRSLWGTTLPPEVWIASAYGSRMRKMAQDGNVDAAWASSNIRHGMPLDTVLDLIKHASKDRHDFAALLHQIPKESIDADERLVI